MKKWGRIIALVAVLVVLVGVYAYLNNRPQKVEDGDEKIEISKFDKEKIVKMVIKSKEGTLTLEKKGDEWKVDYPYPVKLKEMYVDDIAYSFSSLYAERIVEENPDDLAKYGLDSPVSVAEATLDDGSVKRFYVGDRTPNGTYYLMAEGDPKVYEVWMNHGEHFSYTLSDIRDRSLTEIDTMELTYFKMQWEDNPPIEIRANEDRSEDEARFGLGLWKMTAPYNQPMGVDGDDFQKVLDSIPALEIEEFIDDNPDDLSKYGLDHPRGELLVKDKENTLYLYFGKDKDEKQIYFRTADSKAVYTMEKRKLEFMKTKPFTLVEKFAFIVNIDDVDKIIVEGRGKTHTLTLTRTTKKAEKEGEEDEVITTYRVDGKEVEEEPFKKYYQSLIGLLVDAENDREIEGEAEVRTTFFLNKGSKREYHIDYVPYDRDFYAVFRDGKAEFVISRDQVQLMLDNLEALIEGRLEAD